MTNISKQTCAFNTARATQELPQQFGWDVLAQPPHSYDLAPSDYHLFTRLKEALGREEI